MNFRWWSYLIFKQHKLYIMNSPKTCSTKSTPSLGKIHLHRFDTVHRIDAPIGRPTMTTLSGVFERRAASAREADSWARGCRLAVSAALHGGDAKNYLPPRPPHPRCIALPSVSVGDCVSKFWSLDRREKSE